MKTVIQILSKTSGIKRICFLFLLILFINLRSLYSQYPVNYQYTLLPSKIIDELIGAASGDLAMLHINEMAAYSRPRTDSEYKNSPNEIDYLIGKLREYGIKNFRIEKFGKITTWRGLEGSLWEVSPGISKIADYNDLPEMLAEGSEPADVKAPLIWAGEGLPSFFETNPANLKGRIILTSGSPLSVHSRALKAGALGTISYYSPRPFIDPIQIPNTGITGGGFAFMLPPREGQLLRDRLLRYETIIAHAHVNSKNEEIDIQVPQCVIEGSDTTAGEILFTAHLFEGYVKMGANDNISGSAVLIEVAHVLNDLINEGRIPRPVRNIRFLWVPEFTGTIPWANSHPEIIRKALCDINLDMVGLRLRDSKSFMYLHRSGFSTSHFVNDVMESYYRYVGETNSEGITDYLGRRGFTRRIVSPTGTDDPFYYRISSLHGSSDNAVFNDWGIGVPGVKMITWPDDYYHTSEDNPDKCDPTQLRRVIFIAAAGAYTMASADDAMAIRILSEMYAGTCTRMGIQMAKSSDMIWNASAGTMKNVFKRASYNLEGFIMAEKSAMEKIRQISENQEVISTLISGKEKLDNLLQIQLSALRELMITRSKELSVSPADLKPDNLETTALRIIPVPTEKKMTMGFEGDIKYISALSAEFRNTNSYKEIINTSEAAGLADGKRNLLQIKKMVDAQFEKESPLQDMINYFKVLKEAGLMKF
jgi:aminopeptidase-like protein